jgi:hypothetical protein
MARTLLLLLLLALPGCAKTADTSSPTDPGAAPTTILDASPSPPIPSPDPSPDAGLSLALPPVGPRGEVRLDPAKPSRPLAAVAAAFAQLRPRLRRCYNHGLEQDAGMAGSLTLVLQLAPGGPVASVTAKSAKGLSDPVVQCMLDAIRRMELEDAGSATGRTLELPIVAVPPG